jgi:hypothetical protein
MPERFRMVVVDGIRYRPDDPKLKQLDKSDVADKATRAPKSATSSKRRPSSKRVTDGGVADES